MSLGYSTQQSEYLKTLNSNIILRKEILQLSDDLKKAKQINKADNIVIAELQKELLQLEEKLLYMKSRSLYKLDSPTRASIGIASISSCTRSSSIKKLHLKELDTEESNPTDTNFFESFYIIGPQESKGRLCEPVRKSVLFSFPAVEDTSTELLTKIKALAFPNGVKFREFSLDDSASSQIYEVLFRSYYRNGSCFVGIVDRKDSVGRFGFSEMLNDDRSVLYGCFLVFEDIASGKFNMHFVVEKCYCLLSYFPCFELHFEVLFRLLAIKRASRFDATQNQSNLLDHHMEPLVSEELTLIRSYHTYLQTHIFSKALHTKIHIGCVESIDYTFSRDYSHLDTLWFCPLLFSILDISHFYYLLCAVLQEKRVCFCSRNLDILTSTVLGLNSLIFPFRWKHELEPLLPEAEIESVCRAGGCIVGVAGSIDKERLKGWVLVDIDCGEIVLGDDVQFPYSYSLVDMIAEEYQLLGGEPCYMPSEAQVEAAKSVIKAVRSFNHWIVEQIMSYNTSSNVLDFQIHKEIIKNHAGDDKDFFSAVIETDMFMDIYTL